MSGINIKNNERIVNAKLGSATLNKYGKTFAIQLGLDGISVANVVVQQAPDSIVSYLEGDNDITQYAVPINVDTLCDYALASFPNIEELTLFSLTMVTFDETNLLNSLPNLTTVYVPQSLLSAYQSAYPNITFDEVAEDYVYVLEDYTLDHVLTSDIVNAQLNALTSQQRNAITKLVISSTYTSESVNSVVWAYNFSNVLPSLNNNIWYNETKFDFSEYTIQDNTIDHVLTADVVEEMLGTNYLSVDKYTEIEKIIVPVDFTSYASGSITELQSFMTTNSIDKLVTTYSGGAMELDLQGDIVTKIVSIGKTLDEALVYARTFNKTRCSNDTNLIIVPPLSSTLDFTGDLTWGYNNNLVYIAKNKCNRIGYYTLFNNTRLIKIEELTLTSNVVYDGSSFFFNGCVSLKSIKFIFNSGANNAWNIFVPQDKIENIILQGFNNDLLVDRSLSTNITREALVDLINSLGIPATQKTLTINATNLAKLTNADIQLAYDKNWALSPTPSAFSFDIGSNTYSCAFGMTWLEWCNSVYNTDGFVCFGDLVTLNGKAVQLNGIDVNTDVIVRYGDEYTLSPILPAEYQQVEYIESTGTQYIDTLCYATGNTRLLLTLSNFGYNTNSYIFGRWDNNNVNGFGLYSYNDGETLLRPYGNTSPSVTSNVLRNLNKHVIDYGYDLKVDNTLISSLEEQSFTATKSIHLFSNEIGGSCSIYKAYSCQIYNNNVLMRNFIPCYRKADNEIGFYDSVNGVFYTNAGIGTFTKGPDIN